VLSLVREPRIRCWSHIDERCGGFFALGAAKAAGRPVALACTSGTAAANYAPAVIEAYHARVPLIVLTADRPAELRDVGAGQTIDQLKLFGDAVKMFVEVGVDAAGPGELRWIRTLACRAFASATSDRPGPVHVNFPLREPLVLESLLPDEPHGGREGGGPWVSIAPPALTATTDPGRHAFERTVFVAGALGRDPTAGARLARIADRAHVPLLADPLSGARTGPAAIAHYDLLLRDGGIGSDLIPQVVCRIGELPTSKPLRHWLARLDVPHVHFADDGAWHDPDSRLMTQTVAPLGPRLAGIERDEIVPDSSDWLDRWRSADAAAAAAIDGTLPSEGLSEPLVAGMLGRTLPAAATLFVASSMPIRDVEEFFPVRDDPPRVLSNRGANGIDGTVSSAFGVAAVSPGPVVLLIGDVALAHDLGGLLAARRLGLALTIVLVNNDGGGIFHFLPVAGESDVFEEHVATPHGLGFADAARLYGCEYDRPRSPAALEEAVARAIADGSGTTILEVRTDRVANRELHALIELRALAALTQSRQRPAD
jgi:2-succinyl-5-enolpyruvyl-6-hydroxy-3-cyclohexene-1-carboxylate synthase